MSVHICCLLFHQLKVSMMMEIKKVSAIIHWRCSVDGRAHAHMYATLSLNILNILSALVLLWEQVIRNRLYCTVKREHLQYLKAWDRLSQMLKVLNPSVFMFLYLLSLIFTAWISVLIRLHQRIVGKFIQVLCLHLAHLPVHPELHGLDHIGPARGNNLNAPIHHKWVQICISNFYTCNSEDTNSVLNKLGFYVKHTERRLHILQRIVLDTLWNCCEQTLLQMFMCYSFWNCRFSYIRKFVKCN